MWGRLRRLSEAARAQYLATEEARQARDHHARRRRDAIRTWRSARSISSWRLPRGRVMSRPTACGSSRSGATAAIASGLDVQQAEQLLYTATGQIASLEREIAQAENALSLLLGQAPADVPRGRPLEAFQAPPSVPVGLPSALLERRPDIRQAEQQLIAANAQIGAAKAEYFPRISLTGFFGGQSRALAELLTGPGRIASASLGATAPIFNAGKTRANVRLAEAVKGEAVVNYQRAIYTALRDVADSLAGYMKTSEQRAEQERLVEALRALGAAVHRAVSGRTGQLPAGARCAAESVRRRAPARAAPPAAVGVDRAAVSRARRRVVAIADGTGARRRQGSSASETNGRGYVGTRHDMAKRMIVMLVVMVVFIAGLAFIKFQQFQAMAQQFAAMQPPPDAVTTIVAQREEWPATLSAIGTVAAVQGVTVSADLPGIVDRIAFESGTVRQTGRHPGPAGHASGAGTAGCRPGGVRTVGPDLRAHEASRRARRRLARRSSTPRPRRRSRRRQRSVKFARRSSEKPFTRRFQACSASGRSTSVST